MEAAISKRKPDAVIVFEIPLLFEACYERNFDKTIAVHSTRETTLKRLAKKGFSRDDSLKRISAQMPISRKKRMADFCIDNNGSIDKTEKRVKQIFRKIQPR
jgi:dephospho-CoA kinase